MTGRERIRRVDLPRLREKAFRESTGLFLAEGPRFLFAHAFEAEAVVSSSSFCDAAARAALAAIPRGVPHLRLSPGEYAALSAAAEPSGVAVIARQQWRTPRFAAGLRHGCWLAFHEVRSPGNLGSALRTAAAAGAIGAFFLEGAADPYEPAAVRAAMGALASLVLVRCDREGFEEWRRKCGAFVVGTSARAAPDYRLEEYRPPVALMIGCERQGMSALQRGLCDATVRIPMAGPVSSLNLAAAAAVLLYEAYSRIHPPKRAVRERRRGGRVARSWGSRESNPDGPKAGGF